MHPDLYYALARQRQQEVACAAEAHRHLAAIERRRHPPPRPARPPGRMRRVIARACLRLAVRLTDEPMVVLPRR